MKQKRILNKKGLGTEEWLGFIPYIVLTLIVMTGIFTLVNIYINITVDTKPLQREILFNRIMYSPDSIIYTDDITGKVYPGVIDWDRFTNETLDNSIKYSYEKHMAAKLELYDLKKDLVKTAYLNNIWYNRLEPLARNRIKGAGSAWIYPRSVPTLYRKNEINRPGYLRVEIIIPN